MGAGRAACSGTHLKWKECCEKAKALCSCSPTVQRSHHRACPHMNLKQPPQSNAWVCGVQSTMAPLTKFALRVFALLCFLQHLYNPTLVGKMAHLHGPHPPILTIIDLHTQLHAPYCCLLTHSPTPTYRWVLLPDALDEAHTVICKGICLEHLIRFIKHLQGDICRKYLQVH